MLSQTDFSFIFILFALFHQSGLPEPLMSGRLGSEKEDFFT